MSNKERRLKELEGVAKRLEREITKSSLFSEGIKGDFWKAVEGKFKMDLDSIEKALDGYRKLTADQIRDLLADRLNVRRFLDIRDYVKAKTAFENRLNVINERIRELRESVRPG